MISTSALQILLNSFRNASVTEREKGTYFEELIIQYLRNEASYQDLYSEVWTYAEWAKLQGLSGKDTGIDLVAKTHGTDEFHAIQCKFFSEDYRVQKSDIDSFFTASGKKTFTHRIIITTTNNWNEHAEDALQNQHPPVSKIDLNDLENSQIDWSKYQHKSSPELKVKKQLRPHQLSAHNAVFTGFETAERGKMIMACGTGKTFTSLKIAESVAGEGKRVLFLVPSLSLLSQTLTEWTQESQIPLHSFAVCSDSDVGKKRKKDDDIVQIFTHELRYPATTEPARLAVEMAKRHDAHHMSVVFSTYHSINVINKAQLLHGLADFDLIICDEAHRTTGAKFDDDDESNFVKVHDATFIKSAKRLYMTATPRIYSAEAEATAERDNATLYGMNNEELYGKELYVITFSEAVKQDLLVDYKVLVLAVDEAHVSRSLQKLLSDDNNSLKVDDAAKIIGCWKALSKQDTQEDIADDNDPMRRAVAFCQVIEPSIKATSHKVSSKNIASMFSAVVEAYKAKELEDTFDNSNPTISVKLKCEAEHIDGGMNASQKESKLTWLKAEMPDDTCRILSNVRCLSEGVDVPALDAVLFLTPRNSQVDVVQSVGRVMRKSEGKKRGYVVLPVVIPAGMEAHEALNDNKTYKVVWQVLQALRSHDDRFDAMVNKLDLTGKDISKMEVIAITDKINKKTNKTDTATKNKEAGKNTYNIGETAKRPTKDDNLDLQFNIGEIERAIYAKVVQKCGNRSHWEDWANDIAKIAKTHITRITTILENPANTTEIAAFTAFAEELRDDLNNAITNNEVIEMLAQHLITKPVFDALFEGYSFASNNPMSLAMQEVLNSLHAHNIDKEADTLKKFYDSVKMRAEGIDNSAGKQKIVVELYDKFFRNAFPKMTERLGIVYTPVEVVDFIIHSVNDILQSEFGQNLGSENVHIIDPFTGTGTFITRLMQSGLISKEQLKHKYENEIHANEIVLLAYYIAAINIESVYHDIMGSEYQPFSGICLTDTFQLHEKDDLVNALLVDNSARRIKQKNLDIRVIIGNPPYSVGQVSDDDNNANISYPSLDESIKNTYVAYSTGNPRSLYDTYIKAIRWATNRIGGSGVIAFVCGSGFIEKQAMDGMRKCLAENFTSIFVLNLRGDIRKNMLSKGKALEGQNIFGSGCMTGNAIVLLIKNPKAITNGNLYYHDIGDDLKKDEKLQLIKKLSSLDEMSKANLWSSITPDHHNDWINKRDLSFSSYMTFGDKKNKTTPVLFNSYSRGVATNRDVWCYNFAIEKLIKNMNTTVSFYNSLVEKIIKEKSLGNEQLIEYDLKKISWSWVLRQRALKGVSAVFDKSKLIKSMYRPYTKTWMYYDAMMNENRYLVPSLFPTGKEINPVIMITGKGSRNGFSALITNVVPDLNNLEAGTQCFPLYLYTSVNESSDSKTNIELFPKLNSAESFQVNSGISNMGLSHFQEAYPKEIVSKEDVFYYIYGLLHSEDYKTRYADNLSKELPRIPCVKKSSDFWHFSKAGRDLAELHINYETMTPYPVEYAEGTLAIGMLEDKDFYVTQMKFAKGKDVEKYDKTTVVYNRKITMTKIPLAAYEYVVNGKPALEWVMERQSFRADDGKNGSGILNDANDWAIETMGNAKYPLELFQRVITVSLETMKIVNCLPKLDI